MRRATVTLIALLATVLSFQACSQTMFSGPSAASSSTSGNGDSYLGKPGQYAYFDPAAPCSEKASDGTPFPNKQIFIDLRVARLVRDDCKDIEPVVIESSRLSFQDPGFVLDGYGFSRDANLAKYDVASLVCPGGRQLLPSPTNTNRFSNPLDWTLAPWSTSDGVAVSEWGTLMALPRFKIERNNPAYLETHRRVGQIRSFTPGKTYAFRALVEPGNISAVVVHWWASETAQFGMAFDLATKTTYLNHNIGAADLSATLTPYGDAFIATVFFTVPAGAISADLGLASYNGLGVSGHVDDFIYATAADLREVDEYCAP